MLFDELNINEKLKEELKNNNLLKLTNIQELCLNKILNKEDVAALAKTGSGKTLTFVVPILNNLSKNEIIKKPKIKTLVLTPTRELALQVANVFSVYGKTFNKNFKVASLIGNDDISNQLLYIQKGCDVVIATPGRLIDIINKKQINLKHIEYFVLDEADKMLNDGFKDELTLILNNLPKNRQNLFFSATYNDKIQETIKLISQSYTFVQTSEDLSVKNINQRAININKENRNALLKYLIKKHKYKKVLVFMATQKQTDNVAYKFIKSGFNAQSFHGNLEQSERNYTLNEFKNKNINILFCTDLASRGLHIEDIDCVINFDLPRSVDDYIHRIGRTARAGKSGDSITFVTLENQEHFELIKKKCKLDIHSEDIQNFKRVGEVIKKEKGKAPIKGKRKSKKDKLREQNK